MGHNFHDKQPHTECPDTITRGTFRQAFENGTQSQECEKDESRRFHSAGDVD